MPKLKQPMINNFMVSGRIASDPELKHVGLDKNPVCNTSIAVDDGWGDTKKTMFFGCTFWGKAAEQASKLTKGSPVVLEGRIGLDEWEDKKTGEKRSKNTITVNRFHELAWPDDEAPRQGQQPAEGRVQPTQEQRDSAKGVPF